MPSIKFKKVAITNQQFNSIAVEQASFNHVDLIDRVQIETMLKKYRLTDYDLEESIFSSN